MGERRFPGLYSLIAMVTFGLMIYFYGSSADEPQLWTVGDAIWIDASLLMWLGSILFVGSFVGNPALPGRGSSAAGQDGVFAITRHPMMWGFALLGDRPPGGRRDAQGAGLFDGAILLLASGGSVGQDAKKKKLMGERWHEWSAQTAFMPFARGLANPGAFALIGGTCCSSSRPGRIRFPLGLWRWIG